MSTLSTTRNGTPIKSPEYESGGKQLRSGKVLEEVKVGRVVGNNLAGRFAAAAIGDNEIVDDPAFEGGNEAPQAGLTIGGVVRVVTAVVVLGVAGVVGFLARSGYFQQKEADGNPDDLLNALNNL